MCAEFDVAVEQAYADAERFVNTMVEHGQSSSLRPSDQKITTGRLDLLDELIGTALVLASH